MTWPRVLRCHTPAGFYGCKHYCTVELAYNVTLREGQMLTLYASDVICNCGKIDNVTSIGLSANVCFHMQCGKHRYKHSFWTCSTYFTFCATAKIWKIPQFNTLPNCRCPSAARLFLMGDVIRAILHTVFVHLWPDNLTLSMQVDVICVTQYAIFSLYKT